MNGRRESQDAAPVRHTVDVLAGRCPMSAVATRLPLALIEQIDELRGRVSRSAYLAMVVDAAMTRAEPHLPEGGADRRWLEQMAGRRYRQHVRSIEQASAHAAARESIELAREPAPRPGEAEATQ